MRWLHLNLMSREGVECRPACLDPVCSCKPCWTPLGNEEGTRKHGKTRTKNQFAIKLRKGNFQVMNSNLLWVLGLGRQAQVCRMRWWGCFCIFVGLKSVRIQRRIGNNWHRDKMRNLKQVRNQKSRTHPATSARWHHKYQVQEMWSLWCRSFLGPLPRFQDAMEFLGDDSANVSYIPEWRDASDTFYIIFIHRQSSSSRQDSSNVLFLFYVLSRFQQPQSCLLAL